MRFVRTHVFDGHGRAIIRRRAFVEQDQDRRVEARMDEILTVPHRLEARLDAAERGSVPVPAPRPGAHP